MLWSHIQSTCDPTKLWFFKMLHRWFVNRMGLLLVGQSIHFIRWSSCSPKGRYSNGYQLCSFPGQRNFCIYEYHLMTQKVSQLLLITKTNGGNLNKCLTLRKFLFCTRYIDDLWILLGPAKEFNQIWREIYPKISHSWPWSPQWKGSLNYLDLTISQTTSIRQYNGSSTCDKIVELSTRPETHKVSTSCITPSCKLFVQHDHKPMARISKSQFKALPFLHSATELRAKSIDKGYEQQI